MKTYSLLLHGYGHVICLGKNSLNSTHTLKSIDSNKPHFWCIWQNTFLIYILLDKGNGRFCDNLVKTYYK